VEHEDTLVALVALVDLVAALLRCHNWILRPKKHWTPGLCLNT
jgi:hypothetical protein